MASTVTVVSQVAAVAAVSAGAFYFVRGKKKAGTQSAEAKTLDPKKADAKEKDEKTDEKAEGRKEGRPGEKKAASTAVKKDAKEDVEKDVKAEAKKGTKRGARKDVKVKVGGTGGGEKPQQSQREDGGIIGLTAKRGVVVSQLDPKLQEALKTPAPEPKPPVFKSVGSDIANYMGVKESPPKKETKGVDDALEWAGSILSGLDSVKGVLVANGSGDVVWGAGPLIGDTGYLGEVVDRVKRGKTMEVMSERVRDFFPFLAEGAEGATVLPIGDDGGVLVLASEEGAFFGPVEERMATAVAMRLASVLKRTRKF